jgi:hypothetical protein
MRRSFLICAGMFLGVLLTGGVALAQAKGKEDKLEGTIHMINKDTSTITLRVRGNVQRQVVYTPDTKYTYRNKPGSMEEVKEGRRVICLGTFNDKTQLVATRIDVREGK